MKITIDSFISMIFLCIILYIMVYYGLYLNNIAAKIVIMIAIYLPLFVTIPSLYSKEMRKTIRSNKSNIPKMFFIIFNIIFIGILLYYEWIVTAFIRSINSGIIHYALYTENKSEGKC